MNFSLVTLLAIPFAVAGAGHALLYKRDPRASLAWIFLCLAVPFAGPLAYFLFGMNRIRTRARSLPALDRGVVGTLEAVHQVASLEQYDTSIQEISRVSTTVTGNPLLSGNRIALLIDGTEAYPRMLAAIDSAQETVYLSTYIFGTDATGRRFVDALASASARGVEVRVLIDGIGEWYSRPRVGSLLSKRGVPFERFLPAQLVPPRAHINLRNHRKIMLVDHRIGFTGGINITADNVALDHQPPRVRDMHFELGGPILHQLESVFIDDWLFASGERLPDPPAPVVAGEALCRVVSDGPNQDFNRLLLIWLGTLSAARRSIEIVTPYFIPSRELIAGLLAAVLRGVEVKIVLPQNNNLVFVHWATRNLLWELLERGVRVFYQPGPFVHTKLYRVDDHYVQIGSANVDPRSLRLNFEVVVEVIDEAFAAEISKQIDQAIEASREISLDELDRRSMPERVRDSIAWLASPYL